MFQKPLALLFPWILKVHYRAVTYVKRRRMPSDQIQENEYVHRFVETRRFMTRWGRDWHLKTNPRLQRLFHKQPEDDREIIVEDVYLRWETPFRTSRS